MYSGEMVSFGIRRIPSFSLILVTSSMFGFLKPEDREVVLLIFDPIGISKPKLPVNAPLFM